MRAPADARARRTSASLRSRRQSRVAQRATACSRATSARTSPWSSEGGALPRAASPGAAHADKAAAATSRPSAASSFPFSCGGGAGCRDPTAAGCRNTCVSRGEGAHRSSIAATSATRAAMLMEPSDP
eukprot:scaffold18080_cov79-Isochrysis_galbana.AAC.1